MNKYIKFVMVLGFSLMLIISTCVSVFGMGVVLNDSEYHIIVDYIGKGDKKYEQEFLQIEELNSPFGPTQGLYYFEPLYEYYSEDISTNDEAPSYVLIFAGVLEAGPAYVYGTYGDYVVQVGGYHHPYTLGYCVYIPRERKVLSLRDAYDFGLDGIESVFTDYKRGRLVGDIDEDRNLTVKDATCIQKCLAGVKEFPSFDIIIGAHEKSKVQYVESKYISDFNRDGKRDIRDATAIQKCIAGLPY